MKKRISVAIAALLVCASAFADPAGMVYVEGGTFQMGSNTGGYDEQPIHKVTVASFYIGKYEVTQAEYLSVMGSNPSSHIGDSLPVESVSWYMAVEYCNRRSLAEGLVPCYRGSGDAVTCDWGASGYRLPTEAEWEYAATGGCRAYLNGIYSGSNDINSVAWHKGNSEKQTYSVGTKAPNALGIYDMSGNVWEWCWDWYGSSYYDRSADKDPAGSASGSCRVMRGGSFAHESDRCRCAHRGSSSPGDRYSDLGFRVVRSSSGSEAELKIEDGVLKSYTENATGTVVIPDGVTSIGDFAFYGCSGLTSVTIPGSVTSIGESAFSGCSSLASVTIPGSVTSIGKSAFSGCTGLKTITVDSSNAKYSSDGGILYNKDKTELVAYPSASGSCAIPTGVTVIGESAFWGCSGLTSVTIPGSVTSIGDFAFYGCSGLKTVKYGGTQAEWKKIKREDDYLYGKTITGSDGSTWVAK